MKDKIIQQCFIGDIKKELCGSITPIILSEKKHSSLLGKPKTGCRGCFDGGSRNFWRFKDCLKYLKKVHGHSSEQMIDFESMLPGLAKCQ